MHVIRYHLLLLIIPLLCGCSQQENNSNASGDTSRQTTTLATVGIEGENIVLYSGPTDSSDKIVNEKATAALGKTEYCQVDYSTKVQILEKKDDWVKIRVVKPDWLSASHIGWIPSKYLISNADKEKQTIKISTNDYEIIDTQHNSAVENFHVYLKKKDFDKDYIYQFTKALRKAICITNCNISLYDSKTISSLIDVYPLEGSDYIKMADHLISISTFDATEIRDWYPYQDFHYKELGGKNLKKESLQ